MPRQPLLLALRPLTHQQPQARQLVAASSTGCKAAHQRPQLALPCHRRGNLRDLVAANCGDALPDTYRQVAAIAGLAMMSLGGCTTGAPVIDDQALAGIGTSQQAIAVMTLDYPDGGERCDMTALQLASRTATAFLPTSTITIRTPYKWLNVEYNEISQLTLPPGEHHIVSYVCHDGGAKTTVGTAHGTFFGFGGKYTRSLARFDLAAGEVVNVGQLKLNGSAKRGLWGSQLAGQFSVQIQISDQPASVLAKLKATNPKLFDQMKTRLMTVGNVASAYPPPAPPVAASTPATSLAASRPAEPIIKPNR
jgi:hypothetical protein